MATNPPTNKPTDGQAGQGEACGDAAATPSELIGGFTKEKIESTKPVVRLTVKLRNPEGHPGQMLLCRDPRKRKIVRAGRRGGKTTGAAILALEYFLRGKRVLYACPTIDQVQKFWKEVTKALDEPIRARAYYKNETEHVIEY